MIEINVDLTIDDDGNILIICGEDKDYTINFEDKTINAQKVYDLLDYDLEKRYIITSNLESVEETRMKEYFEDVVNLFKKIVDDVNSLNETTSDESELNETISDENEFCEEIEFDF